MSSIRRKPISTYKSPSGGEWNPYLFAACTKSSTSSLQSHVQSKPRTPIMEEKPTGNQHLRRQKYLSGPSLPLYHPLGRLALSLPPLDPAAFGLPVPIMKDDPEPRSSARPRKQATKLRDVEDEFPTPMPSVSTIAAVAAREIKEKASPRKKRVGGGAKRKRKEADDGDATYPAKRTRVPRGMTNQMAEEEESPEAAIPAPDIVTTPEPAGDDRRPERRTTRSRGSTKRRDSSASANASLSISPPAVIAELLPVASAAEEAEEKTTCVDRDLPCDDSPGRRVTKEIIEEKEEGELSEEGQVGSGP
ncbi:hypothetical protein BDQ12DRAFT_708493 [Crucibulum laeve]|uniref:Uncharacterized protein n=1 Tax=Crucibulum laeve TaxID=68775 RepID=A0A5C3MIT9_9AGAR|nr:hypothetical protein BDQ12DRAFT_708493 [Crucibulum laeve]